MVYFHAGCRYSYDLDLRETVRNTVSLLKKSGVDVGIAGTNEFCCGGRAYELGYIDDFIKIASVHFEKLKRAGVSAIVTSCSDCYHTFKVLYDKIGIDSDIEVFHITEFLDHLVKNGTIVPKRSIEKKVTYHDPCHLGRMGEPWKKWDGEIITDPGTRIVHEPKKEWRKGSDGVYDSPRTLLKSIPGIKLLEMDRIREYSYCCGAGGGVIDAYPDFSKSTATKRIDEAKATGAEAIVTSCPWCIRNFRDAINSSGIDMEVHDVTDLFLQSV